MGLGWFIAIVWAYHKPGAVDADISRRIENLERELKALQAEGDES